MNSSLSFGNWLKSRRRALALTQGELAKQVFCAAITIRKIEADRLRPSRELARLIVNALNIALTEQHSLVHWARQGHPEKRDRSAGLTPESVDEIQGFARA